jgi:hypothetical protein
MSRLSRMMQTYMKMQARGWSREGRRERKKKERKN